MRLRLYPVNTATDRNNGQRPYVIDRFPHTLFDPSGWSPSAIGTGGLHECCEIVLSEGTLYVIDTSPDESTRVNGRPVHAAAILPGDRITLNTTELLVSYERMTIAPPLSVERVLIDAGRCSPVADSSSASQPSPTGAISRQRQEEPTRESEVLV